ncbi:MAG: ATP-binding cassette domain-containing protein [Lawsonella clevelandensis]
MGPNGSGKTTLLYGILRTVAVTGDMEVLGGPVSKVRKGAIGYVPQVADLDPTFPVTVRQVVEMGALR